MNTRLFFILALVLYFLPMYSQNYHEDDKDGLRFFLRQKSSKTDKLNLECFGLSTSDTLNWHTSEDWIESLSNSFKYRFIDWSWSSSIPSRLTRLELKTFDENVDGLPKLSGKLHCASFSDLEVLNCSDNHISEIDVLDNPKLLVLNCSGNKISSLDLSRNVKLSVLNCSDNIISALDLTNLDYLISLYCSDNKIANIDLSKNKLLEALNCDRNLLKTFDLSNNKALKFVSSTGNPFSTPLDLSSNIALRTIYSASSQLNQLRIPHSRNLELLYCSNNNLTALNLVQNPNLSYLYFSNNNFSSIDLSSNEKIKMLDCSYNGLRFSTLLLSASYDIDEAIYSPQDTIDGGDVYYYSLINLSSEYNIDGHITEYKWFDEHGTEVVVTNLEDGSFSVGEQNVDKVLTCEMTNASFPGFVLKYKVNVSKTETNVIEENAEGNVLIYINPVTDILVVEVPANMMKAVDLYDIMGRRVKKEEHTSHRYEISLQELPSGVYLIHITFVSGQKGVYKIKKN